MDADMKSSKSESVNIEMTHESSYMKNNKEQQKMTYDSSSVIEEKLKDNMDDDEDNKRKSSFMFQPERTRKFSMKRRLSEKSKAMNSRRQKVD